MTRLVRGTALVLFLGGCGGGGAVPGGGGGDGGHGGGADGQPTTPELYSSAFTSVVLEVDYQAGAPPYTGPVAAFGDTWNVFLTNAERLFLGSGKTLEVPTSLAEMEELADVTGEDFTSEAILAVADAHRDRSSAPPTATFYALWLDGYWHDGGERKTGVLGVSFGGTGVIAMFKPVIETATILPGSARFAEQAILVHEFGHAIGLVANGIAVTSAHHDESHGAHCLNDRCVMYWAYESASDLAMFVREYLVSSEVILFADDCLTDVDAVISGG